MTDETEREDDVVLSGEYALGLLTARDTADFEARLAREPGLRTLYARWVEDLVTFTDAIPAVSPPQALFRAIEARLFPVQKKSLLARIGLLPMLLGGLVAALALIFIINPGNLTGPDVPTGPVYTAEVAAEDQSLVVLAAYDPAAGTLAIERTAGAAAEGRVLQLWLIAGEALPVSLGVLPDDATTVLALDESLVPQLDGGVLAISDEPPGGSPTGQPTGDVLAVGPVTTL